MSEYIEREKLLSDIEHYHISDGVFQYCVEVQPAADVEPVRHGRWEENIRGDYCVVCSECGFGLPTNVYCWTDCNRVSNDRETTNVMTASIADYCPNCGAKMDEDDND